MKTCIDCNRNGRIRAALNPYVSKCGFHVIEGLATEISDAAMLAHSMDAESRRAQWVRLDDIDSALIAIRTAFEAERNAITDHFYGEQSETVERDWENGKNVGTISEKLDVPMELMRGWVQSHTQCHDRVTPESDKYSHPECRARYKDQGVTA